MSDMNKTILIGRLVRDAELKFTQGGMAICSFSLAVNMSKKTENGWIKVPNYFDIVCFGKSGESVAKYLTKGKQVCVDGELRQDAWEQDGVKRSKVQVIASEIHLLGSVTDGEKRVTVSDNEEGQKQSMKMDNFDDDIPF